MKKSRKSILLLSAAMLAAASPSQAETYTPKQAISVLLETVRDAMGFGSEVGPSSHWLSLSLIGSVAPVDDQAQVNDLANFCPDPSPLIQTYARARHLSEIYLGVLNGLTGPSRPESDAVKQAKKYLAGNEAKIYDTYYDKDIEYRMAMLKATSDADKAVYVAKILKNNDKWEALGYKSEVEGAFETIAAAKEVFGPETQTQRRRVLTAFRNGGIQLTDFGVVSWRSPPSELSPAVNHWADDSGWGKISFSDSDVASKYSESTSNERGFAGLSLGFLSVGHGQGGGNYSESRVSSIQNFSYTFELKRITIRRPWLDAEVFFQPAGWTWQKTPSSTDYPYVSPGADNAGKPQPSPQPVYDNINIDCALMPLELVIARKRSLTATVSTSDYEEIRKSGSSSTGGGLFGFFGGKTRGWSTTEISHDDHNTTFQVDDPGISIIGVISESIPKLPNPNMQDKWPGDAWLPKN